MGATYSDPKYNCTMLMLLGYYLMEDMISESVSGTFEIVGGILNGPILLPMSTLELESLFR